MYVYTIPSLCKSTVLHPNQHHERLEMKGFVLTAWHDMSKALVILYSIETQSSESTPSYCLHQYLAAQQR